MATQTLKEKVLQSVANVESDSLLQSLLNIIELESDNNKSYEFNEEQLNLVEEAKKDITQGKTQSNGEVNKEIDEWLSK